MDYDIERETYIVEFIDNKNVHCKVDISEKVYEALNQFELEDISQIHKYRKHIEHSELYEETLEHRMFNKPISIEQEVENKILLEDLKLAMRQLSDTQKKRLILYYFEDKTLSDIAKIEGCSIKNVHKSIEQALQKIKKNINF